MENKKEKKPSKKKKTSIPKKIKKNPWILSTLIFGILAVILLISTISSPAGQVSKSMAGNEFIDFINSKTSTPVELVSAADQGSNLYRLMVSTNGQEVPVYITKDGKYYVPQIYPIVDEVEDSEQETETQDIPKSDTPLVQLFVMTHCPYGTQAEKGFVSFAKEMGDDVKAEVRFVHYFMHENNQEEVETPRQVCIREEQPDKFWAYLECFLGGTAGTPEEAAVCEAEVGIDSAALEECISSGRAAEYYGIDSALSEEAGVRGSPSLVINGKMVSSGRSPAAFLDTACQAFNDVPESCALELDTATPSPGFGWEGTGGSSAAQCG